MEAATHRAVAAGCPTNFYQSSMAGYFDGPCASDADCLPAGESRCVDSPTGPHCSLDQCHVDDDCGTNMACSCRDEPAGGDALNGAGGGTQLVSGGEPVREGAVPHGRGLPRWLPVLGVLPDDGQRPPRGQRLLLSHPQRLLPGRCRLLTTGRTGIHPPDMRLRPRDGRMGVRHRPGRSRVRPGATGRRRSLSLARLRRSPRRRTPRGP